MDIIIVILMLYFFWVANAACNLLLKGKFIEAFVYFIPAFIAGAAMLFLMDTFT